MSTTMREQVVGRTFAKPIHLPVTISEAATESPYRRAISGFLLSSVTSVAGMLVFPVASFLAIGLAIAACGLFIYALANLAAGNLRPRSA
jgi:hypothetical protein